MPDRPLARARLVAQGLATHPFPSPADAVGAFGVMQGQDLTGVIASAALRSSGVVEDVLDAMNAGLLVRGYPMRGTIFLAHAADLRWITELCAGPTLRDARRRRERHHDFDDADIERVFEKMVGKIGDEGITRAEYTDLLRQVDIDPTGGRAYHILFTLIAGGRVCYGPWNGTDQQIVLADSVLGPGLEDRFGGDRYAAIAALASRYFRTHGPATIRDFAWWTKLPLSSIRRAIPLFDDDIECISDETFARADLKDIVDAAGTAVWKPLLLPGFDEYILGYQDRLFAMDWATHQSLVPGNNGVFRKAVVVDGVVRGFWSRKGTVGNRSLSLNVLSRIPKRSEPGIRRRFAEYPFVGE